MMSPVARWRRSDRERPVRRFSRLEALGTTAALLAALVAAFVLAPGAG